MTRRHAPPSRPRFYPLLPLLVWLGVATSAEAATQAEDEGAAHYRRFEACAPSLTPFQQQRYRTLSPDQRERFLDLHCGEEPAAADAPASAEPIKRITVAVVELENEAGIAPADKQVLDDLVLTTVEELPRERFAIVRITRDWERPCELACLREDARAAGAEYVIIGGLQPVGEQLTVMLRLYRTTDDQLVASAATDGQAQIGDLVRPTAEATSELFDRAPFIAPPPAEPAPVAATPQPPPVNWRVEVVPTEAYEPPRRRGPSGLRIAAHVVFWPGLVLGVSGGALIANDAPVEGYSSLLIGGALMLSGMICGLVYRARRSAWSRRQSALGPVLAPELIGTGYTAWF